MASKPTVCVDFDGVIHEYDQWDGNPPKGREIPRAADGLMALRGAGYTIVIHTSRQKAYVWAWLRDKGLHELVDHVTNVKVPAVAYFDDRAWWVPQNTPGGLLTTAMFFMGGEEGTGPSTRELIEAGADSRTILEASRNHKLENYE